MKNMLNSARDKNEGTYRSGEGGGGEEPASRAWSWGLCLGRKKREKKNCTDNREDEQKPKKGIN